MRIMLATLVLNEMQWLEKLYSQHKDWPDLIQWVFVESADRVYAETSPNLVSPDGLSVDGTTEFLRELAYRDDRVIYIPHGFCSHADPAMGKVAARQRYLDVAETTRPEFIVILDADEFYCRADQPVINATLHDSPSNFRHFCFQFTHIWHPPCILHKPLFTYEITGGFWDMRHAKGIRWSPGLHYVRHHQRPESDVDGWGGMLMSDVPVCIHMAFASEPRLRNAKHAYYVARGEGRRDGREGYVRSRALFEHWRPGNRWLPRGVHIRSYTGPIPECFR